MSTPAIRAMPGAPRPRPPPVPPPRPRPPAIVDTGKVGASSKLRFQSIAIDAWYHAGSNNIESILKRNLKTEASA